MGFLCFCMYIEGNGYIRIGVKKEGKPESIRKGGVWAMKIDAVQLALLCASHFIITFSYEDLDDVRYHSDYDMDFKGRPISLWCDVRFDKARERLVRFRFDANFKYEDEVIEIDGSVEEAEQKAIALINEYLAI